MEVYSSICDIMLFTLNNPDNELFWINQLEKLLDPVKRAYLSDIPCVKEEDLPRYYLFNGSTVMFKEKEYVVCSVNHKSISIQEKSSQDGKTKAVGIMDRRLSIPYPSFRIHFNYWLNSLSVGEIVDIAVKEHNKTVWKRGLIMSIEQTTKLEVIRVGVRMSASSYQQNDQSNVDIISITEFSPRVINRAFLFSVNDATPLLEPLRFTYTHNLLFFRPNICRSLDRCSCGYDCEARVSSLYIDVLETITSRNILHSLMENIEPVLLCFLGDHV